MRSCFPSILTVLGVEMTGAGRAMSPSPLHIPVGVVLPLRAEVEVIGVHAPDVVATVQNTGPMISGASGYLAELRNPRGPVRPDRLPGMADGAIAARSAVADPDPTGTRASRIRVEPVLQRTPIETQRCERSAGILLSEMPMTQLHSMDGSMAADEGTFHRRTLRRNDDHVYNLRLTAGSDDRKVEPWTSHGGNSPWQT